MLLLLTSSWHIEHTNYNSCLATNELNYTKDMDRISVEQLIDMIQNEDMEVGMNLELSDDDCSSGDDDNVWSDSDENEHDNMEVEIGGETSRGQSDSDFDINGEYDDGDDSDSALDGLDESSDVDIGATSSVSRRGMTGRRGRHGTRRGDSTGNAASGRGRGRGRGTGNQTVTDEYITG